jgi:hypothetical protein
MLNSYLEIWILKYRKPLGCGVEHDIGTKLLLITQKVMH